MPHSHNGARTRASRRPIKVQETLSIQANKKPPNHNGSFHGRFSTNEYLDKEYFISSPHSTKKKADIRSDSIFKEIDQIVVAENQELAPVLSVQFPDWTSPMTLRRHSVLPSPAARAEIRHTDTMLKTAETKPKSLKEALSAIDTYLETTPTLLCP